MKIVRDKISISELKGMAEKMFGTMVKAVVDIEKRIEFDSIINLRPSQGNRSRNVEDPKIRKRITGIANNLIKE